MITENFFNYCRKNLTISLMFTYFPQVWEIAIKSKNLPEFFEFSLIIISFIMQISLRLSKNFLVNMLWLWINLYKRWQVFMNSIEFLKKWQINQFWYNRYYPAYSMDSAFLLDKVYTSVEFHAIFKNILFNNLPFRSLWRHYQPPPPPKKN